MCTRHVYYPARRESRTRFLPPLSAHTSYICVHEFCPPISVLASYTLNVYVMSFYRGSSYTYDTKKNGGARRVARSPVCGVCYAVMTQASACSTVVAVLRALGAFATQASTIACAWSCVMPSRAMTNVLPVVMAVFFTSPDIQDANV